MSYLQYELLHISAFLWFLAGAAVITAIVFFDFVKERKANRRDPHE